MRPWKATNLQDSNMIDTFFSLLGIVGASACVIMFFVLERQILSSRSPVFYLVNGTGAFMVLVSAAWSYDGGDTGAIIQESCWCLISLIGLAGTLNKKELSDKSYD